MINRYVLPRIGRVPLRSLTITHLEDLYAHLRLSGRHDGGPLAPKTVLNVHQILRTALGDAELAGLVHRNVARLMDPPCHGAAPEQRCWNEHQLRTFLNVAMTHRLGPAIWLAAMTGMRRGEVLSLRWTDIDLNAASLSIRRSVSCTGYRVHTTPTKTRTSRQAIDLDQRTVAVLRDWQHQQFAELGTVAADGTVFTRPDGGHVHPHSLSQTVARLQRAAGVPAIRLQDLRHTHATLPTPSPASSHPSITKTRPSDGGSGTVATRHAKRTWSDMASDQGLWWRGQDLNRRPSGYEMDREIRDAIERAEADRSVVGIVITGAGRAFCAGADMNLLSDLSSGGRSASDEPPLVDAPAAATAGMAYPFALCCDLRIGTPNSLFVTAFAQRGLIAEWGLSWLLPRLVGPAVAMDLLLSSRRVSGEEALRLGLLNEMVPPDELLPRCHAYVQQLADTCSPASMAIMKQQVNRFYQAGIGAAEAEAEHFMAESFGRPDFAEGVQSFMQRRSPNFPRLPLEN